MIELDSTDRALVAALQLAPRAALSAIAPLIDCDPSTLSRRYRRLADSGRLQVRAMLDWRLISPVNPSIVWIRCAAGASEAVAEALRAVPEAQSILLVTGEADVHAMLYPGSREAHRRLLTTTIPSIPGVVGVTSQLILDARRRGGQWRLDGALEPAAIERLRALGAEAATARGPHEWSRTERAAIRLLFDDGRIGANRAAELLGVSRATALRVIRDVLGSGRVSLRVEVEPSSIGLPLTALIAVRCPPGAVSSLLDAVVEHPATRFAGMTAGSAALMLHASFADEDSLGRFIADDLGRIPGVDSLSVSISLATLRRDWLDLEPDGSYGRRVEPPALADSLPAAAGA